MEFEVILKPDAMDDIDRLRKYYATCISDAIEHHLTKDPEKVSRSRIKRLRGQQPAEYRLRVGAFRVFYTVDSETSTVFVLRVLGKEKTAEFYRKDEL